jgi:threonine/homoserine/homoserine lactone efflux protein
MYLLYVASRLWRASAPATKNLQPLAPARALRAGLLTNLSNPKSALFFGSVFSAALPASPSAAVLVAAVALVVVNAFCWHLLLAFVFSRKAVQVGYAAQRGLLARLAAVVVGGLGLSLLVASVREARS